MTTNQTEPAADCSSSSSSRCDACCGERAATACHKSDANTRLGEQQDRDAVDLSESEPEPAAAAAAEPEAGHSQQLDVAESSGVGSSIASNSANSSFSSCSESQEIVSSSSSSRRSSIRSDQQQRIENAAIAARQQQVSYDVDATAVQSACSTCALMHTNHVASQHTHMHQDPHVRAPLPTAHPNHQQQPSIVYVPAQYYATQYASAPQFTLVPHFASRQHPYTSPVATQQHHQQPHRFVAPQTAAYMSVHPHAMCAPLYGAPMYPFDPTTSYQTATMYAAAPLPPQPILPVCTPQLSLNSHPSHHMHSHYLQQQQQHTQPQMQMQMQMQHHHQHYHQSGAYLSESQNRSNHDHLFSLLPIAAMPAKLRQAYGMDKVWQDEFEHLFAMYANCVVWTLMEVESHPNIVDAGDSILAHRSHYLLRAAAHNAPDYCYNQPVYADSSSSCAAPASATETPSNIDDSSADSCESSCDSPAAQQANELQSNDSMCKQRPAKINTKFRMFIDSAKVRFCCDHCGHGWTSMKGRVVFWYELFEFVEAPYDCVNASYMHVPQMPINQIVGFCAYKLFGQQCDMCKVDGRFERPMWYPEEVCKVLNNLYNKIGQIYFGFKTPALDKQRRAGKPKTSHNSSLCQACQDGVCADRK